ncbi:MAG TPA: aminotransferase class I/II-fold pyridoxal phosphate-dependent enzyme [Terriglobales bacterium]|nr:aminotransferase class I/II-fold pyridoxal phosphate-dependent enzyme [Terriglobales bacterium]
MELSTRAVHGGPAPAADTSRPVSTPIHPSATFYYDHIAQLDAVAGGAEGYMYARYRNPTVVALEAAVADLEGAEAAVAFGSGMAALHAAIMASGVVPGDAIVCSQEIYGGTVGLLLNVMAPLQIDLRFADLNQPEELDRALSGPGARLVLVESLSNPLLRVLDLRQVAEKTHAAGAKLLVDATFTSPALLRALDYGADYSVHSATKYLGGHGDVTGGVVACSAAEQPTVESFRKLVGGILGPFEAWLVLRGLQTLPLRMERQCANAARFAGFLRRHPRIERVYYPGFADHPDHATAARQFASGQFGGMVSFEVKGADKQQMFAILDRLKLTLPCTSLGDVQTLVMYPLIASHRDLSPKQRQRAGIGDNLLRVSVGIEAADDILADWDRALRES